MMQTENLTHWHTDTNIDTDTYKDTDTDSVPSVPGRPATLHCTREVCQSTAAGQAPAALAVAAAEEPPVASEVNQSH